MQVIHNGTPTEVKKFTLNKSNFEAVSKLYGTNSDNWVGKEMEVAKVKVRNPQTGTMVDSIALVAPTKTHGNAAADSAVEEVPF